MNADSNSHSLHHSISASQVFSIAPAFFPIGINLNGNSGLAFETASVNFLS